MKPNPSGVFTTQERTTHTYVIGQPGTGKSRALESWIMQDIAAGQGVAVIDPHGELYDHLVWRLAQHPKVWSRVVLVDPTDPHWAVNLNPLARMDGQSVERVALFMSDILLKIWGVDTTSAPRMVWLMTNTFLALSLLDLTLLDLPRFLLDKEFRTSQLTRLSHPSVLSYFHQEFPPSHAAVHQWVTPLLNKIGALIFDPDVRLMLGSGATLDFRKLMDGQKILLVNLPKGVLGEGASALLGAFIVARIQKAALARTGSGKRKLYFLYLDEFQNYTTENIADILAESRKYGLSLILAHQYLEQLSGDIRSAVLNTAGTVISFRVGYGDASRLAKDMFPSPDFTHRAKLEVGIRFRGLWPQPTLERVQPNRNWDQAARLLTGLRHREFWVRRRGLRQPQRLRTYDMPDLPRIKSLMQRRSELLHDSGRRYGRPKADVEREIAQRYPQSYQNHAEGQTDHDIPLWDS